MPKRILVIDDDPRMLMLGKTILVQGGLAVETASDGVEGLAKLQAGRYDGIILDVMMPRMDGYETAKEIKELEGCEATPILMVTASVEPNAMTGHELRLNQLPQYVGQDPAMLVVINLDRCVDS